MPDYIVCAFGGFGYANISKHFGSSKPARFFNPENDIYPDRLMTSAPSSKRVGFDKLEFAVINLQHHKIASIISEHQNNDNDINGNNDIDDNNDNINIYFSRRGYGNILNHVSRDSMLNIPRDGNEYLFDKTFMTIIKSLEQQNIHKMINQYSLRGDIFNHINESYLYAIILLNYGAHFIDDEHKKHFINDLKDEYAKSFFASEKINVIINSSLEPGKKLLSIVNTCPITTEPIINPIIIEDGTVYESHAIHKWFETNDTSPLTGIKLKNYWIMYDVTNNEIVYADNHLVMQKYYSEWYNIYYMK